MRRRFRPEFINRIDDIVIFNRIQKSHMMQIVKVQLQRTVTAINKSKNITLQFTPQAEEKLAGMGFDESFGARPLKRVIQSHILNVLALKIIQGEVKDGDMVNIDASRDGFTFAVNQETKKS